MDSGTFALSDLNRRMNFIPESADAGDILSSDINGPSILHGECAKFDIEVSGLADIDTVGLVTLYKVGRRKILQESSDLACSDKIPVFCEMEDDIMICLFQVEDGRERNKYFLSITGNGN